MKRGRIDRRDKASSALVITLLGVVLLTIIVVSFMQTMTLSLTTSKSYVDIRRATFAAQGGLDTAIAQISLAAGTNLAFVTGQTNYPYTNNSGTVLTNYPITLIGAQNLTNLDQVMPLVSGNNIADLANFGVAGWGTSTSGFVGYVSQIYPTANPSIPNPTKTVDVNTAYEFIECTNTAAGNAVNVYPATWVTMTNRVGSQVNYTRYAYVVLDDAARINPALMTGTGTGFTDPTNWYAGPQDINVTTITNSAGGQLLSSSQLTQITNSVSSSNSFGYSDATLGETYASSAAYQTNKIFLTSRMNPSFDVIPAWYPNGGMPKYNINDLATNTAYGASGMARALNIASIITNNLPNFYTRDPALTAGPNPDPTHFLYVSRLAANMVDYISLDGTWPASDYTTNNSGISPQGHGVYPVSIFEQDYVASGAGSASKPTTNASTFSSTFWLSVWNPYTTPVTIQSANLHVYNRPGYSLGNGTNNAIPDYTSAVSVVSGYNPGSSVPYVVQPNEFVVMGFAPQLNTVYGNSTNVGPASVGLTYTPGQPSVLEQYALTVNGQTTAQSGAQSENVPLNAANTSGGLMFTPRTLTSTNQWADSTLSVFGPEVADPRFLSYHDYVWTSYGVGSEPYLNTSFWKGVQAGPSGRYWDVVFPPTPAMPNTLFTNSTWANRDNIARSPAKIGSFPTNSQMTPDQWADEYTTSDSNAAPEVIRNGPMVSIGELGYVYDPANANDALTDVSPRPDGGSFANPYSNGGARSLRIGRPEENGAPTVVASGPGSTTSSSWDANGERAISLLDLFTVNNTNTTASVGGATNSSIITQNMNNGGVLGRININTASTNVLAAVLSGIQITSDSGMTNSSGTLISPVILNNVPSMVNQLITNRPYSSLSDLYKTMPMFDTNVNYSPNLPMTTYAKWNDGNYAPTYPYLVYPATLNVFNRVHQEAFGKLVQHLTVQSRSYRVYVIGQVLDVSQNPRGSVAMEAGIYLQYNPNSTPPSYNPVIQYVRVLK